jgi:hypothetical protein
MALGVAVLGVLRNVLLDLDLDGLGQHSLGSLPQNIRQHITRVSKLQPVGCILLHRRILSLLETVLS